MPRAPHGRRGRRAAQRRGGPHGRDPRPPAAPVLRAHLPLGLPERVARAAPLLPHLPRAHCLLGPGGGRARGARAGGAPRVPARAVPHDDAHLERGLHELRLDLGAVGRLGGRGPPAGARGLDGSHAGLTLYARWELWWRRRVRGARHLFLGHSTWLALHRVPPTHLTTLAVPDRGPPHLCPPCVRHALATQPPQSSSPRGPLGTRLRTDSLLYNLTTCTQDAPLEHQRFSATASKQRAVRCPRTESVQTLALLFDVQRILHSIGLDIADQTQLAKNALRSFFS
mmetsp:Transcript_9983/g.33889  ORF Transcript_9983/g.33889 Transcript_9983/m.33889 type:complete len:284 (+) Transcript_9983:1270-2121(+)